MITYKINETVVEVNEKVEISYGVSCLENGRELEIIKDLSTDKSKVKKLVNTCNSLQLDPVHLCDIAEDFIDETIKV